MKVGSYQDDKLDATGSEHLGSRGLGSSFLRESQPHASPNREECLAHYPFVIVRIACRVCARRGPYRLARLAAKFGPEISLRDLMDRFLLRLPVAGRGAVKEGQIGLWRLPTGP